MEHREIREGEVKLKVPDVEEPEEGEVFYNSVMEFDRNLSVSFASLVHQLIDRDKEEMTACDLLSATGVRGLRYSKEAGLETTANDVSEAAVALIRENAERNGADLTVRNMNANQLLREEMFSFIDIDPFGSPARFLEPAAYAIPFRGAIAATATDTGALVGAYPKACARRYGLRPMETDYGKEMGVRVLTTAIQRACFRYEKTFWPVLSYVRRHYIRVYGAVRYGNKHVNRTLREFGYISHCSSCGWRETELVQECPECKEETEFTGEIWLGEIQDRDFLEEMEKDLRMRGSTREAAFVGDLRDELALPFYYDTHYLAKKMGVSVPSLEKIRESLRDEGFQVSRTHFCDTALKTNTDFEDVRESIERALE